jgi:drug/metabolite transporter (DMT)-like permease
MDPLVAASVLGASLLHASWHALVKSTGDRVVALAGMNVVSAGTALALLPFTSPLPAAVYAVLCASALVHVGYKIALAQLYDRADLGRAYPLARGFVPVMATALAFALLGEVPAAATLAGILLVCAGLLLLAYDAGGRSSAAVLAAAAGAGLAVAVYSVVDAYGIRLAGDWFSFTVWLLIVDGGFFVGLALATRGRIALLAWRSHAGRTLASGALGVASFAVFMWALGRASVGAVTALRETSVLFAAIIGAVALGERATWERYAAAALVMAGIATIALKP